MAKFKVGDRVRVLPRDKALAFSGHGATAGKEYTVKAVRGDAGDNIDTELWSFFDHEIELVPALTIEPGRHYRTRSGKVTGRVFKGDTGFEAVVDGKVRIFDGAGGAVHGDDDIVEAWVPKVGERVRYSGKSTIYNEQELVGLEGVVSEVGNQLVTVKWDREVVCGISTGGAKYIENVEPLSVSAEAQQASNNGAQVDTIAEEYGPVVASDDNRQDAGGGFKSGDRIRLIHGELPSMPLGSEFVAVPRTVGHVDSVHFKSVDGITWRPGSYFRLVSPAPATAIVALIEDGQPKPATRPYVHATEASASTEAKRLAGLHKGKQFGVFVLTTAAEEAKPTYSHEWQRLAADGQKIAAIKELRSLTGMMLKPAKDVVEHFVDNPYNLAA